MTRLTSKIALSMVLRIEVLNEQIEAVCPDLAKADTSLLGWLADREGRSDG